MEDIRYGCRLRAEPQLDVAPVEKTVEVLDPSVVVLLGVFRIRDEEEIHGLGGSLKYAQTARNDAALPPVHVDSKVVLALYLF